MTNIVNLGEVRFARQLQEEKKKIVLAAHVDEALAEYNECEDDDEFTDLLLLIKEDVDKASEELLAEYYWWAAARRYAIKNRIREIGKEFYESFNPESQHAPTLRWARSFLSGLPNRYSAFLGGAR